MFKIINDEKPDYLAVILDSKTPTFRHHLFTEYKANRKLKYKDQTEAEK